jgi:hypothetical protein
MTHLGVIWIVSLWSVFVFSTIDNSRNHLFLSFCIQFFRWPVWRVSIVLQRALASAIERKIALVGNACSRPLITIRPQSLHVDDIKGPMGEIPSYLERD